MAEVFDLLTRPIDPRASCAARTGTVRHPRYIEADSEEEMHALFRERHYTDFLPIILPTEERVEQMLTRHEPCGGRDGREDAADDRHGVLALRRREDRDQRGDGGLREPKHLPVLLALASERRHRPPEQHVLDGEHGRRQRADPARDRDELRHRRARAVQPRECGDRPRVRDQSQNLQGGSVPGVTYNGSQGCNFSYNCITLRRERGGGARGSPTTSSTASTRTRAPSPSRTSGATSGRSTCASTGRRSSWR